MWKAFPSVPTSFISKAQTRGCSFPPGSLSFLPLSLPVLQPSAQQPWVPHPPTHPQLPLGKPHASFEVQLFPTRQLEDRLSEGPPSLLQAGQSPARHPRDPGANLSPVSSLPPSAPKEGRRRDFILSLLPLARHPVLKNCALCVWKTWGPHINWLQSRF